jgi:uncharacterized membrane protein
MDRDHMMHHPQDGFGFWHLWHPGWHGFWPELFGLALPALFLLPLLGLLAFWLWPRRHALLDWLGIQQGFAPIGSLPADEVLRQRYARGEIDDETYTTMLDRLNASERYQAYDAEAEDQNRAAEDGDKHSSPRFSPRPDLPVDWS